MSLDDQTRERIDSLIQSNDVVLFMKGDRQMPQCGFSSKVIQMLDGLVSEYETLDVLSNPDVRDGIKIFSSWPTIPQLYVKGEFIGGCDIITELYASGELHEKLGVEVESIETPQITITQPAAQALAQALENGSDPNAVLHLSIDASFQGSLGMGPAGPGELKVEDSGIALALDPMSAKRANGIVIDVVDTPQGLGFRIDNPNAPRVGAMDVEELKRRLDAGDPMQLFDVRTPEERATASIPGSILLTEEEANRIASMPRDSVLAFHCHHGGRSLSAAEHFAGLGFTQVYNIEGGIDAWSQRVDTDVPRY
jgi:monothiol glutaredoxin